MIAANAIVTGKLADSTTVRHGQPAHTLLVSLVAPETLNLKQLKKLAVAEAMRQANYDPIEAAVLLGVGKSTLYRYLKEWPELTGPGYVRCPSCGHKVKASCGRLDEEGAA